MRQEEYLQMCSDLEEQKPQHERDEDITQIVRMTRDIAYRIKRAEDYFNCDTHEWDDFWRSLPDYTELYCDLYSSISVKEGYYMLSSAYGEKEDESSEEYYLTSMLFCLIHDLEDRANADMEKRLSRCCLDRVKADIADARYIWNPKGWAESFWRGLPGFPELYYDLYYGLSLSELRELIDDYLSQEKDPKKGIDWNIFYMLSTLERDLMCCPDV